MKMKDREREGGSEGGRKIDREGEGIMKQN